MLNNYTKIGFEKEYKLQFSICTIVTDMEEYSLMKKSFEIAGFTDNCEYLMADNTSGNKFDGYLAIRRFLQESNGNFTIIVHQDVRCEDNVSVLTTCLNTLDINDKNWAICGNAGGVDYKNILYYLNNNGDIRKTENLPKQVFSLDENFLVIKTGNQLAISSDITGFHFYGTDLTIIANFLGYTCYVIPFMVKHLSKGNLHDMLLKQPEFLSKYGKKLHARFIQTTCTKFYLGNSSKQNRLYNSTFIFFWVKALRRFYNAFRS